MEVSVGKQAAEQQVGLAEPVRVVEAEAQPEAEPVRVVEAEAQPEAEPVRVVEAEAQPVERASGAWAARRPEVRAPGV